MSAYHATRTRVTTSLPTPAGVAADRPFGSAIRHRLGAPLPHLLAPDRAPQLLGTHVLLALRRMKRLATRGPLGKVPPLPGGRDTPRVPAFAFPLGVPLVYSPVGNGTIPPRSRGGNDGLRSGERGRARMSALVSGAVLN